ncbi:hypothetical protein CNEO3_280077 [Clostridium neonatale]|nr:hypothetical protein CNEO_1000003 [Clostridium neonatale]CAI3637763.1 hypothetical protein CNEO3_280077 [Clostridium neonatale]CAI3681866.1 hypothetical protein CNEO4_950008 [Clostridium neonatale]CAI3729052.1 hypothetical protein CNEO2_900004 [Clostridium neonatale]
MIIKQHIGSNELMLVFMMSLQKTKKYWIEYIKSKPKFLLQNYYNFYDSAKAQGVKDRTQF